MLKAIRIHFWLQYLAKQFFTRRKQLLFSSILLRFMEVAVYIVIVKSYFTRGSRIYIAC